MATVTITFGPKTKTYTVIAGSLTRLQNWAAIAYPFLADGVTPNPDPVGSAIDAIWQGVRNNVIASEKASTVAAVPTPGDLT